MTTTRRRGRADSEDRRKATFLLSTSVLAAVDAAVSAGLAPSKNAFVEGALDQAIGEIRQSQRRVRLKAAMEDPLFRRDLEDVERDFRFADAESAELGLVR
jgi:hypothetical protein